MKKNPTTLGNSLFKGESLPKMPKGEPVKQNDEPKQDSVEIIVPTFQPVNQRIICHMVASKMVKKGDIFLPQFTKITKKDGSVIELPRFFVAACAPDIFIETKDGKQNIMLEPGTEVFPFWPEIQDFSFPEIRDPHTQVDYTILHWTELGAYGKRND